MPLESSTPKVLAVIPARGGSKGLPRKNIRLLAGKPLVAHTIEAARNSRYVQRVVVSTDDAEIAATSNAFGAIVVRRPAEISGDTASSELALLHTLEHLATSEGYFPDVLVFLQCTSPLTAPADIDNTIEALISAQADSAFSAIPFYHFLWRQDSGGIASGINHDQRTRPMRQQREPQFLESGAVYAMRAEGFCRAKHRFFGRTTLHVMPAERVLEIDDLSDFKRAEAILNAPVATSYSSLGNASAVVFDFDGVLTDNGVYVMQNGRESVRCERGDGMGISLLHKAGMPMLVLSGERNSVVRSRCQKLGLPCKYGVADKLPVLMEWASQNQFPIESMVYVGNDINDLDCLKAVGCGVAVADAHPAAKRAAKLTLTRPGGHGAVRELADLIVQAKTSTP